MKSIQSIISLSGLLALGFLLVVLAIALYGTWLPLWLSVCFAIAPLPLLGPEGTSSDSLFDEPHGANQQPGQFLGWFLVVTALVQPVVFWHAGRMAWGALVLSQCGGSAIFAAIVIFWQFFHQSSQAAF